MINFLGSLAVGSRPGYAIVSLQFSNWMLLTLFYNGFSIVALIWDNAVFVKITEGDLLELYYLVLVEELSERKKYLRALIGRSTLQKND